VLLGGGWFTAIGLLRPVELAPEVDRSALVGFAAAATAFGYDGQRANAIRLGCTQSGASANPSGNWAAMAVIAVPAPPSDQPPSAARTTPVT
jgi:hypothetical protein